jgi:hypothetical protein
MSISSLANAAAARRSDFAPFNTVPLNVSQIAWAASRQPVAEVAPPAPAANAPVPEAPSANGTNTVLNVLFGYIPTEILTLYVPVVAALQQATERAHWIAFWCFLVATPVVVWVIFATKIRAADPQKPLPLAPRAWPVWEIFAAAVAYSAWAFALPNTPFGHYNWYSSAIAAVVVLVASTVLGLLAPYFNVS